MNESDSRTDAILQSLGALWRKHPDMRLGQLINNLTLPTESVALIEDDLIYARILAGKLPPNHPKEDFDATFGFTKGEESK